MVGVTIPAVHGSFVSCVPHILSAAFAEHYPPKET